MVQAKKTVKKAAARKRAAKKPAPTSAPATAEGVAELAPGEPIGTVEVPLSTNNEHNGRIKRLTVRQPTPDQMAWADGAFYRVSLAMEAARAGEAFDQRDRGRVFNDVERMAGVFLSEWEADWAKDAVASGSLQLADMWTAMSDAFERAGGEPLPVGDDADIVVE
jgi:hypothetical protein